MNVPRHHFRPPHNKWSIKYFSDVLKVIIPRVLFNEIIRVRGRFVNFWYHRLMTLPPAPLHLRVSKQYETLSS